MTLSKKASLAALIVIIACAMLSRGYFIETRGGDAPDQVAWAITNYFGGITQTYLSMRDAILSGAIESRPWSYLPGYPAFLAVVYALGVHDLFQVRILQSAIDALAILPLYYVLARLSKSAPLALVGCLSYATAPWWSVGSTYLLAESLLPALFVSLLAAMVWIRDRSGRTVAWFLLGLFASILPFFRTEMILLVFFLGAWPLLTAGRRDRARAVIAVSAGFILPLALWAARNEVVHGRFMLTPPVKWYVAWSGLAQVDNSYGYEANDARAMTILQSKGLRYHSPEAEEYWKGEYFAAWRQYPSHVASTIVARIHEILARMDTHELDVPYLATLLYGAMAILTPILLFFMVREGRYADAYLIALPALYAVASLGFMYLERRYVRYAGLSYILAFPIVLGIAIDRLPRWPAKSKATIKAKARLR